MSLLKKILFVALTVFSISCFARASVPIIEHTDIEIPNKTMNFEKFKKIIKAGGEKSSWQVVDGSDKNTLVGTLNVRGKHTISVTITYNTKTFSVTYKNSHNMNYKTGEMGEPLIHPKYNEWVKSLITNINLELGKN